MNKKQIVLTLSISILIIIIANVSFFLGGYFGTMSTYKNVGEREIIRIKHFSKSYSDKLIFDTSSDGEVVISGNLTKSEFAEFKKKLEESYFQNKLEGLLKYIKITEENHNLKAD